MDNITRIRIRLLLIAALIGTPVFSSPAHAADTGTLEGKVAGSGGEAAFDAEVTILELRRSVQADKQGQFKFSNVAPGRYLIEATSRRFGSALGEITVVPGQTAQMEIKLDLSIHSEEIQVTSSPNARGLAEVYQPSSVLSGQELSSELQPTLGETLSRQEGVSSTYFGPGASRPVIRGLGGDRVRVLQDGVGTGDASTVSPDHAVTVDPLAAERIEVVRGPAALLYGGSAVGGVVNILDNRIPAVLPEHPVTGQVDLRAGSVADETSMALALDGKFGNVGWHLDGLTRETGDYDIPDGSLANSDLDTEQGTAGASYVGEKWFAGGSWGMYDTNYGNPAEPDVRIDMEQRRADIRGEYRPASGFFSSVRARFGLTDYEHQEIEAGAVATTFLNDSWEGRVEAPHRQAGPFAGTFGAQAGSRDLEALGDEAFIPANTTDTAALFGFEEIGTGKVRVQAGARVERVSVSAGDVSVDRDFTPVSGSAGVIWVMPKDWSLAGNAAWTQRAPTAEELVSNGPHLATERFEVGDPDLDEESAAGLDISVRRKEGRVTGTLTLFMTRYNGFVSDQARPDPNSPGGIAIDPNSGLEIFDFAASDAEFVGGEAHVDIALVHTEPHHVSLELFGDLVRAEDSDTGEPLPRITPARYGAGVSYQGSRFWGRVEVRRTATQDRVADLESSTRGYTMLGAVVGYRILQSRLIHEIVLRGTNLTDEEAHSHVSQVKDLVPLPGADVSLNYRLVF